MKLASIFCVAMILLVGLTGCMSKGKYLIGTWRVASPARGRQGNVVDAMKAGMMGAFAQNMTIEFAEQGKFKVQNFGGAGTGTYRLEGDKVHLKLDTFAPSSDITLQFSKDGKDLETENSFESDAKLTFVKVQ